VNIAITIDNIEQTMKNRKKTPFLVISRKTPLTIPIVRTIISGRYKRNVFIYF
jgi:hypothetical protein